MIVSANRKQFKFNHLHNDMIIVFYKPILSKYDKREHYLLFDKENCYKQLARKVMNNEANWVEMNYLAMLVSEYTGNTI